MWETPIADGVAPEPRFGHSCAWQKGSNRLVFVGGSNGGDLLRDGDDLYGEVCVLTVLDGAVAGSPPSLSWSTPVVHGAVPHGIGGRTHTMVLVGDCMLMFGGGADVSPALGMLKLLPVVPGELSSVEWIDKNPAVRTQHGLAG